MKIIFFMIFSLPSPGKNYYASKNSRRYVAHPVTERDSSDHGNQRCPGEFCRPVRAVKDDQGAFHDSSLRAAKSFSMGLGFMGENLSPRKSPATRTRRSIPRKIQVTAPRKVCRTRAGNRTCCES